VSGEKIAVFKWIVQNVDHVPFNDGSFLKDFMVITGLYVEVHCEPMTQIELAPIGFGDVMSTAIGAHVVIWLIWAADNGNCVCEQPRARLLLITFWDSLQSKTEFRKEGSKLTNNLLIWPHKCFVKEAKIRRS